MDRTGFPGNRAQGVMLVDRVSRVEGDIAGGLGKIIPHGGTIIWPTSDGNIPFRRVSNT